MNWLLSIVMRLLNIKGCGWWWVAMDGQLLWIMTHLWMCVGIMKVIVNDMRGFVNRCG